MLIVSKVNPEDIDEVVNIHLLSFEGFFLSFLGPKFIKLLYSAILQDRSGIAYKAEINNKVVGFLFGSSQPNSLYKRLIQQKIFQFALASLHGLARNPKIIARLLRALSSPSTKIPIEKSGLLLSIAVQPEHQSKGIGKLLVKKFLADAQERGLSGVYLHTDANNNESTNFFYQSLGFSIFRRFSTPEGRVMIEYLLKFS